MKPFAPLNRKKTAIVLMSLGGFLILFILVFVYFKIIRIPGFPELLPVNGTIGYVEFPTSLTGLEDIKQKINETLKINWDSDVTPWASEKGALIFLKSETPGQMLPFIGLQVRSMEQAYAYLKTYQNATNELKEAKVSGITAFSTPSFSFAFLSNVLVISPSESGLQAFLGYQSALSQHLSSDNQFRIIKNNLDEKPDSLFVYAQMKEIPSSAYSAFSHYVPQMPFVVPAFPSIGITLDKTENKWEGSSYALLENPLSLPKEEGYGAKLLSLIPADFDTVIAGQNLASQIDKIEKSIAAGSTTLRLADLFNSLTEEYFKGVDFEKDVKPLFAKEFAFEKNESKILLLTELGSRPPDSDTSRLGRDAVLSKEGSPKLGTSSEEANIQKIRDAFMKIALTGKFTPKTRDLLLPDGKTKVQELIPDLERTGPYTEDFNGININGILLGKSGVYDAIAKGIWFISNDLATLKKAILLTQEPGLNFRDSSSYSSSLQSILKNPELLGTAVFPQGIFSFSKHTFEDHMETNFSFVID